MAQNGSDSHKLSLVLPAYNEAQRLGASLHRLAEYLTSRRQRAEVLIVDDGSSDGTAEIAEGWAALMPEGVELRVLFHHHNQGKGAAVKTGCLAASGQHVLFTDVDLASPLEDCESIVAALENGADVAVGTRIQPDGSDMRRSQPLRRRVFGRLFTFVRKRLLLPEIDDTQCPLKGFQREAARRIFAEQRLSGWAFDAEIIYIARKLGMRVVQVPVHWQHVGGSTLRLRPGTAMRVSWDLLRLRFLHRRLRPKEAV